jgi:membrane-associated protease RseP (regulator of RpoE activity)
MRFRILGFPVQVHPFFFLVAALLGGTQNDLTLILVWVAVVFVSVLAHELGHALAARANGQQPSILLYSMGGLTRFQPLRELTPGQSIAISLAGPGAGFLVGSLVWAASQSVPPDASFVVRVAVHDLLWVNFGWGFLNLLPILPLDGGNVVRSVLHAVRRRPDERLALLISITVGGLACLAAFNYGLVWAAVIAALISFNNYQALSRLGWTRSTS